MSNPEKLVETSRDVLRRVATTLDTGLSKVENALVVVTGGAIFLMAFAVTANVVSRAAFNDPIPVITLVQFYLLTAAVFLPMGFLQREDGNVRIELLRPRIPARVRKTSEVLTVLVGVGVFLYFIHLYLARLIEVWRSGQVTGLSQIQYPLWPHWGIALAGLVVLTLRLIVHFVSYVGDSDEVPK